MRILIRDEQNTLTCIETTYISYDTDSEELWFTDSDGVWTTEINRLGAENEIRNSFKTGELDLSYLNFTYEEFVHED